MSLSAYEFRKVPVCDRDVMHDGFDTEQVGKPCTVSNCKGMIIIRMKRVRKLNDDGSLTKDDGKEDIAAE